DGQGGQVTPEVGAQGVEVAKKKKSCAKRKRKLRPVAQSGLRAILSRSDRLKVDSHRFPQLIFFRRSTRIKMCFVIILLIC
ncbi:MAG: hypothetical protein AAFR05_22775, partial [Bacteroidota bacterium]